MKKVIGTASAAALLVLTGCGGHTDADDNQARKVQVSCQSVAEAFKGRQDNTIFTFSGNCDIKAPIRITGNHVTIVGHGKTLTKGSGDDGIIVEGKNVVIDGFTFKGFRNPLYIGKQASVVASNIRILDSGLVGIAVGELPKREPRPVSTLGSWLPSFQLISAAHATYSSAANATYSCNNTTGQTLCALADNVINGRGWLDLGANCPQLTLCGKVSVSTTVAGGAAIHVGDAATLDNRANLTLTANSSPNTARALSISGSSVNVWSPVTIENTAGWGIYFNHRGGTLNVQASVTVANAQQAVHCGDGETVGEISVVNSSPKSCGDGD